MPEDLMSDSRRALLLKAAEDTIGLMNIGVDGNAALAKVAKDSLLNDHEVDLVTHAVNNSKQLAHIQTSSPEDREKTFPIINSKTVKSFRDEPTTNADINTGERYGVQETLGDSTAEKQDAPDAVEIQDKIMEKDADFRLRAAPGDNVEVLREGWGLKQATKVASYVNPTPYAKISAYTIGLEEARLRVTDAKNQCLNVIEKLANALRQIDAPRFARVEQLALTKGASAETLDLIYNAAQLHKFREPRYVGAKVASRMYVSTREMELAELCVHADTFWKKASDIQVAMAELEQQRLRAVAQIKEAADTGEFSLSQPYSASLPINPGAIGEEVSKGVESIGLTPEIIRGDFGEGPTQPKSISDILSKDQRQSMANTEARSTIENLMGDEYIGSHSLPEVVEAYNAAMSVNPGFGRAELVSYIRQHLATKGAVPLDLQLRASRGYQKGSGE